MDYEKCRKIPNLLKKHRKISGLKQKDVAKILELKSSSLISRWEKGLSIPSLINVFKLSILYRTMADSLFNDLVHKLREEVRELERNYYGKK